MNPNPLDDLVNQILRNLPESVQSFKQDASNTLRAQLEAGLRRLDLVTRQEFEVQRQLLERAQQQLKMLEDKIKQLEQSLNK